MPFREKTAWISLAANGLVFGGYFLSLWQNWRAPLGVSMLLGAVACLIVITVVLAIVAAILAPKEANAPADEREQMFDLKAERIASYVLSVGVVCLIGALLLDTDSFLVANLLLAAMVVSELTKASAQIIQFREGA